MKYSLIHILILPEIIKNVKHAGFFNFNQTEMSSGYGINIQSNSKLLKILLCRLQIFYG